MFPVRRSGTGPRRSQGFAHAVALAVTGRDLPVDRYAWPMAASDERDRADTARNLDRLDQEAGVRDRAAEARDRAAGKRDIDAAIRDAIEPDQSEIARAGRQKAADDRSDAADDRRFSGSDRRASARDRGRARDARREPPA